MNKKLGILSIFFAFLGVVLFLMAHFVGDVNGELTTIQTSLIYIFIIVGPISFIVSLVFSFLAFKKKEVGKIKYLGLLITVLFLVGSITVIFLFSAAAF